MNQMQVDYFIRYRNGDSATLTVDADAMLHLPPAARSPVPSARRATMRYPRHPITKKAYTKMEDLPDGS